MNESITPELLSCPFCGGEANGDGHVRYGKPLADTSWADGSNITEAFFVNCIKCGVDNGRPGLVGGYQTKAEAIEAWNTRSIPTPPDRSELVTRDDAVGRLSRQLATGNGVIEDTDFIRVSIVDLRAALNTLSGDGLVERYRTALDQIRNLALAGEGSPDDLGGDIVTLTLRNPDGLEIASIIDALNGEAR